MAQQKKQITEEQINQSPGAQITQKPVTITPSPQPSPMHQPSETINPNTAVEETTESNNTDHQLTNTQNSSLVSVPPAPKPLTSIERTYEYIVKEYSPSMVFQHIRLLTSSSGGRFCPHPQKWIPPLASKTDDICKAIYECLCDEIILEGMWLKLAAVMGDNIDNAQWTTMVATTFLFFGIITSDEIYSNPTPD